MGSWGRWRACRLGGALMVVACSTPQPKVAAVIPSEPVAARAPRPRVPPNIDIGYVLPPKDADGRFITPNSGIGPLEVMFHFRAALNVAALVCATAADPSARVGYNEFLKRHKQVLANANRAIDAKYRREFGGDGLRLRDRHLTSLYNHYSYPSVKAGFCGKSARHLVAANAIPSKELEAFSQASLADIEQVYQDHFADIERNRAIVGIGSVTSSGK